MPWSLHKLFCLSVTLEIESSFFWSIVLLYETSQISRHLMVVKNKINNFYSELIGWDSICEIYSVKVTGRLLIQTRKLLLNEIVIIHIDHVSSWVDTMHKAIETINQRPPTTAINCQNRSSIASIAGNHYSESRRVQTSSELEEGWNHFVAKQRDTIFKVFKGCPDRIHIWRRSQTMRPIFTWCEESSQNFKNFLGVI